MKIFWSFKIDAKYCKFLREVEKLSALLYSTIDKPTFMVGKDVKLGSRYQHPCKITMKLPHWLCSQINSKILIWIPFPVFSWIMKRIIIMRMILKNIYESMSLFTLSILLSEDISIIIYYVHNLIFGIFVAHKLT